MVRKWVLHGELSRVQFAVREVILSTELQKELGSLEERQQTLIASCFQDMDRTFLEGYRSTMTRDSFVPSDSRLFEDVLAAFRISTALSQLSIAQLRGDVEATRIALLILLG